MGDAKRTGLAEVREVFLQPGTEDD